MNAVVCITLAVFTVLAPPSEAGFIKKLMVGVIGGNQNAGKEESDASHGREDNPQHDRQQGYYGNAPQTYKNTSWHIENEDYLTPNANESSQHKHRPSGQYGGGGTYDKKPSTSRPYGNTTRDSQTMTPNESYQQQQRPNSQYETYEKIPSTSQTYNNRPYEATHGELAQHKQTPKGQLGDSGTKRPRTSQPHKTATIYVDREESSQGEGYVAHDIVRSEGSFPTNVNTQHRQATLDATTPDGDVVVLHSDSVTCCYSNVREQKIENRRLRCNDTECRMERESEKSLLWLCGDGIKCNVAKVDFTGDVDGKRLLECTMDGRNIITVQDRPVKCGPNEKAHNGVCRQVFGT